MDFCGLNCFYIVLYFLVKGGKNVFVSNKVNGVGKLVSVLIKLVSVFFFF